MIIALEKPTDISGVSLLVVEAGAVTGMADLSVT